MTKNEERMDQLYFELVPGIGKAESLAGELVRAAEQIGYRFFNDGDKIGVGYGRETCNPAARFLIKKASKEVADLTHDLWEMCSEAGYEALLDILFGKLADYIEANPDLRKQPTADMWSYRDSKEDVDYYDWDDEGDSFGDGFD